MLKLFMLQACIAPGMRWFPKDDILALNVNNLNFSKKIREKANLFSQRHFLKTNQTTLCIKGSRSFQPYWTSCSDHSINEDWPPRPCEIEAWLGWHHTRRSATSLGDKLQHDSKPSGAQIQSYNRPSWCSGCQCQYTWLRRCKQINDLFIRIRTFQEERRNIFLSAYSCQNKGCSTRDVPTTSRADSHFDECLHWRSCSSIVQKLSLWITEVHRQSSLLILDHQWQNIIEHNWIRLL